MSSFNFQKIHDEFRERIFHYLFGMVGKNDAEDLTQVVFEKINGNLNNFRGESSLATWIYRIATNVALDNGRLASSRKTIISLDTIEENCDCNILANDKHLDAESGLMRREMNSCIHRIVMRIPETERVVLLLHEFEGLKNREIADILNITINAVKIRLHRARARLRKDIQRECTLYHDERNELVCAPK